MRDVGTIFTNALVTGSAWPYHHRFGRGIAPPAGRGTRGRIVSTFHSRQRDAFQEVALRQEEEHDKR